MVANKYTGTHAGGSYIVMGTCDRGKFPHSQSLLCRNFLTIATQEQYGRSQAIDTLKNYQKESAERKASPLWSGCMQYFPDALLAVARLSKKANDKHNPGEPLHWSKGKSSDHGDCIARHQLNPEEIDPEFDEIHAVMVAWRALAQLQIIIEKKREQQYTGR